MHMNTEKEHVAKGCLKPDTTSKIDLIKADRKCLTNLDIYIRSTSRTGGGMINQKIDTNG